MTTAEAIVLLTNGVVLMALGLLALGLTITMFLTKEKMLGFPCSMFWVILGGYFYTISTATWDIFFLSFFASAFGMTIFTALSAFALREKRDSIGDEEMEKGDGSYIDETKRKADLEGERFARGEGLGEEESEDTPPVSNRIRALHERARKRRKGIPGG